MTDNPPACVTCAHFAVESKLGNEWPLCRHRVEGKPLPLSPVQQRNQPADEAANVCGVAGIFHEAKP